LQLGRCSLPSTRPHTQGEALVDILAAFAGLGVVSLASEFAGNIGNSLVGQRILATLRKELSAKILRAPIAEIERFQSHRLIAILAQDVATIGGFTLNFSAVAIAFAIAVGCFATGRGRRRYRDGEAELAHAALCARAEEIAGAHQPLGIV
jgi:ABC-type siderophore export system fused ATPase/permease subunit